MIHCRRVIAILGMTALLWTSGRRGYGQVTNAPGAKALVSETIPPVRVIRRDDGVFFVDFGREAFGSLELDLPPGAVGQVQKNILVRMGEKLSDGQHIDPKPGGAVRFLETSLAFIPGKTSYRPVLPSADARGMPQSIGPVMPFRYVELEHLPPLITADALRGGAVRQIAVHSSFDDSAADFACSDGKLNAIWDLSKNTIKATSYAGVFVDGDRERKPYEADAFINELGWYYCTSDTSLPKITQDYLIAHPTWPTEWIMFSVLSADLEYRYAGGAGEIAAHYDDLKAKTLRGLERGDGLISTVDPAVPRAVLRSIHFTGQLKDIVDWPENQRDGYQMVPVNTVVNAFHCRSLMVMAELADALGKADDAANFRRAAARTLESINSKMVDPATGLYIDGEGSGHSSLHANMFPLAFGLVPEDRRARIVAFIKGRGMACSVYGAQFLLDALFENGEGADAVALMRAPGERSWRHMVEDQGLTITSEAWDPRDKPNEDQNHAWGAAPANLLPRMIQGVEPLEPGYQRVLIWPRCAGIKAASTLAWARGKVPTVKGQVAVEWHQSAAGFQIAFETPPGMATTLQLPDDWGDSVVADGVRTTARKQNHTLAIAFASPGKHTAILGKP